MAGDLSVPLEVCQPFKATYTVKLKVMKPRCFVVIFIWELLNESIFQNINGFFDQRHARNITLFHYQR